jgi:hypothetical protein
MIDTLRRYWIGLLVLVMIGLHAGIVGLIRIQASQAKESLSCEVDLGSFYVSRGPDQGVVHLRIHALVPVNHRLQSRQLIQLNQFQVRQAIEEYCRQADPALLVDPLLTDFKTNLMDCMVKTVGETATEDVVITEVRPTNEIGSLAFQAVSPNSKSPKRMVITRQAKDQQRKAEHEAEHAEEEKSDTHGKKDSHGKAEGHGKPAAKGH